MSENVQDLSSNLDRLSALIDGWGQSLEITREARERALARAAGAFEAEPDGDLLATLSSATELIASHAAELSEQPELAGRLIEEVEQLTGLGRVSLGREVLRARQLLEFPSETALSVLLLLLCKFAGARAVSLWTKEAGSDPKLIGHFGDASTVRPRTAKVAKALLDEGTAPTSPYAGINFNSWRRAPAALIADGGPDRTELLLDAAVPVLSTILARAEGGRDQDADQIFTALERRLARLRYDLHDGPQQDVHLLAMDLALFREQLIPIIAEDPNAHRVLGRLDDLAAQLVALDGDLRRLSANVQSPFVHTGSLADALQDITDAFATRTGVVPRLRLSGELTGLTDSQQLTLLALIREALSNIREHSEANNVAIDVASDSNGLTAEVRDDGRGFEPEITLVRAARDGHLGLVGMHERVRMLGGQTQIESKAGGPTVISVSLPRWTKPT